MTALPDTERGATRHIFLVAGEASGDRLGAALMGALSERLDGQVRFSGVGGVYMEAAGLANLFPSHELAIVGLTAIPRRLATIVTSIRKTANAVIATRPDILVIIDSPDFTHRVAKRVRRLAPAIPIADYVSPSVWAWRPGRARAMRRYVDHVLALLPFEPAVHARLGGPPCTYVGHPLIEEAHALRPNAEESRRRQTDPPLLVVLPGSRPSEVRRLQADFGEAVARVQARVGPLDVVVPAVPHLFEATRAATDTWPVRPRVVVGPAERRIAFRNARAALAKSGTVTLELALAGVPMVVAYKVSLIEEIVAHLTIKVPSIVLANLVLGDNVVPELLQRQCRPQLLADALVPLIEDTPARRRQVAAFAKLDEIMQLGQAAPSQRAAEIVLGLAARFKAPSMVPSALVDAPEARL
jgi:lipid-A-disaccharide synthase